MLAAALPVIVADLTAAGVAGIVHTYRDIRPQSHQFPDAATFYAVGV